MRRAWWPYALPFRRGRHALRQREVAGRIVADMARMCKRPRQGMPHDKEPTSFPWEDSSRSLFLLHSIQALGIKLQQMRGIFLGLGRRPAALFEAHAPGRSSLAVAGRHSDELHQVECDIFVAARSSRGNSWHIHERLPCPGNVWNDVVFFFEMHKLLR